MTTAADAADAAADWLYGLRLEPLDYLVIAAAAVALVVLVQELRRGHGPLTPEE